MLRVTTQNESSSFSACSQGWPAINSPNHKRNLKSATEATMVSKVSYGLVQIVLRTMSCDLELDELTQCLDLVLALRQEQAWPT